MMRAYVATAMALGVLALAVSFAGCSTAPAADLCDFFTPSRNACARPVAVVAGPVVPAANDCAKAFQENQNYRPGFFERFHRRAPPVPVATP